MQDNTNVFALSGPITSVIDIAQRLVSARTEAGLTQDQLAKLAKVSQGTIANIESGLRKNPRELLAIADAVGVNAEWLKSGRGPRKLEAGELIPVSPAKFKPVWVVGKGSGGVLPERIWTDGDHPVGATDGFAEVASADPHAFLVEVVGKSMIPKYTPGDFALVEPGTDPDLEDDVLVRLTTGQTMIKRLLSRRGGFRLGSYNDPEILFFESEEVSWLYYIPHPVPRRRIKSWT